MGCIQSVNTTTDYLPIIVREEPRKLTLEEFYVVQVNYAKSWRSAYESELHEYAMCELTDVRYNGNFDELHEWDKSSKKRLADAQNELTELQTLGGGKYAQKYFESTDFGKLIPKDLNNLIGKFAGDKK